MSLQQIPGHYIVSGSATATGGNTLYNTAITATSTASATAKYTATQIPVSAKDNVTASPTGTTSQFTPWNASFFAQIFDWSAVSALDTLFVNIPMNYDVGQYTAFIGTGTNFDLAHELDHVSNGYLGVKLGTYDTGVRTGISRNLWSDLESYNPSTVYVGFGSYSVGQEYTGVMDNYFTGQVTTGTAYPYPDRPVTDYFSATASATAYEWISSIAGNYNARVTGSAKIGTSALTQIYGTGVGYSVSALQTALSNALGVYPYYANYPETAYSSRMSTGSITSGSTGLGL
jgi:hypothetical protein